MFKALVIATALLTSTDAFACSSFLVEENNHVVVGKNFDMVLGHGSVMSNQRSLAKRGLVRGAAPAEWVSKYGSLTFNWVAKELPQGGMNERGLVVEVLWLERAEFPSGDPRPGVGELQWAQYQLDNYATTEEVLAHLDELAIQKFVAPLHYFVCDATKACAVIDPVAGKYERYSGDRLPFRVLTNSLYQASVQAASAFRDTCSSVPEGYDSLARFSRLACSVGATTGEDIISRGFDLLATVAGLSGVDANPNYKTHWSIVYDLTAKKIHFKSALNDAVRTVALAQFDFDCKTPTLVYDVNHPLKAENVRSHFHRYSKADTRRLIEATSAGFAHLPPPMIDGLVEYASSQRCAR